MTPDRKQLVRDIIVALIKGLPEPGSVWPEAERKAWLAAIEALFILAYTVSDDG